MTVPCPSKNSYSSHMKFLASLIMWHISGKTITLCPFTMKKVTSCWTLLKSQPSNASIKNWDRKPSCVIDATTILQFMTRVTPISVRYASCLPVRLLIRKYPIWSLKGTLTPTTRYISASFANWCFSSTSGKTPPQSVYPIPRLPIRLRCFRIAIPSRTKLTTIWYGVRFCSSTNASKDSIVNPGLPSITRYHEVFECGRHLLNVNL